jgi:serine-type D-Ala-D-Ala carboxypeptidase (penicillin-binding protein 5/6)
MTRRLSIALAAVLACLVAAAPAGAAGPDITARNAIVVEATSGEAAYEKAADQERPIASTTKLMTALVVLENAKLGDIYTAPRYRGLAAESKINLRAGERLTVADLLRGLLVYSANDAAETLAEGMSGSRAAFVRQMNRRAVELGLTHTHYANPIGLDEAGNYSSARDLAKLVLALRKYPFFRRTVDSQVVTLRTGEHPRTLSNRNLLVRRFNWIDGVKTGHTLQAGYVLVASGSRRGVPLVSVALGTPSEDARDTDSLKLLAYGLQQYKRTLAIRRGQVLARVPIKFRPGATLSLVAKRSVRRVVPRGAAGRIERVLRDLPDEVEGPIRRGDRIAGVDLMLKGRRLTTVSLVAASDVEEATAARRAQDWLTGPWTLAIIFGVLVVAVIVARMRRRPPAERRPRPAATQEPA